MSFRAKLTVWYSLCLAILFTIFGWSAHFVMVKSSLDTVDRNLNSQLADVQRFIRKQALRGEPSLVRELEEQDLIGLGGGFLEVWTRDGRLLYRSSRVAPGDLGPDVKPLGTVSPQPSAISTPRGKRRMVSGTESVQSQTYIVRLAQPMKEFEQSLEGFDRVLYFLAPVLLSISVLAGSTFSKKALAPVRRMSADAHKFSVENLSQRLEVPPGRDEIRELAVTLNQMLTRIDGEVRRMLQFTEDASHELRTPLALIRSAADFSLRGKRTEKELLAALHTILRESDRSTRLIGDLLTLARTGELRFEPVDLSALIGSIASRLSDYAETKRIEVTLDLPDEPVYTMADETSLGRLLLILLDNALKYTEDSGRVSVILNKEAENVYVTVSDSGIGIAGKDLPRIWDRFWRADKVRTRNAGGTGLGLAIARAVANLHGADLSVESTLGVGSRFQLRMLGANEPAEEHCRQAADRLANQV